MSQVEALTIHRVSGFDSSAHEESDVDISAVAFFSPTSLGYEPQRAIRERRKELENRIDDARNKLCGLVLEYAALRQLEPNPSARCATTLETSVIVQGKLSKAVGEAMAI